MGHGPCVTDTTDTTDTMGHGPCAAALRAAPQQSFHSSRPPGPPAARQPGSPAAARPTMQAAWLYGPGALQIGPRHGRLSSSVLYPRLVRERLRSLSFVPDLTPDDTARTWAAVFGDTMGHASDRIVGAVLLKFEQFEDVSVVFDPQHTMVRDFWMVTKYEGNPLAFIHVPRAFCPCPFRGRLGPSRVQSRSGEL
eukprot:7184176-Pyramimonas_sp.AAC.1